MSVLDVNNLWVTRGRRTLFSGTSFTLDAESLLMITGVNGSGKTTLLRTLAGLSPPALGSITWKAGHSDLVYVGHLPGLKDELTVEENLRYALELSGMRMAQAALRSALAKAGLSAVRHLPSKRLSQGERRRIHLARLMLSPQQLWLLDEPATALDTEGLGLLNKTVEEHLVDGGIAIIATHQELGINAPKTMRMRLQ